MGENTMIKTPYGVSYRLYNISNTVNHYYYFRYNKKAYRGTTKTADELKAHRYVYDMIHDLANGVIREEPEVRKRNVGDMTFKRMYEIFIEAKGREITKRGIKNYKQMSKYVLEYYGSWTENDFIKRNLGEAIYSRYASWRREYYIGVDRQVGNNRNYRNYVVGAVQINKECNLIHNIMTYCKRTRNILDNYKIPSYRREKEQPRLSIPTQSEYDFMKEYFINKGNYYKLDDSGRQLKGKPNVYDIYLLYIRFMKSVGTRVGESLALDLSCIDRKHKCLWIRNRKSNKGNVINTGFPMVGKVREIVTEVLKLTRGARRKSGSTLLFINPETGRSIGYIKKAFKSCLTHVADKVEKPEDKKRILSLGLGCFRHLFFIVLCKQGGVISMPQIARLGGHTSIDTCQRNYISFSVDDLVEAMEDVYQHIEIQKELRKQRAK